MKFFTLSLFTCLFLLTCHFSVAQNNVWSLQRCLQYAKDHNLDIQQQQLQTESAQISYKQSRFSQLPQINSSASLGKNFGRSIDPTTNQFVSNNLTSSGVGLNAGVTLFNFFKLKNTIKANKLEYRSDKAIIKKMVQDLSLNITDAYLQILLANEQVKISKKQIRLTLHQLKETHQKVVAGILSIGEEANLKAQLAKDSATLVNNQSLTNESILQMKAFLNLNFNEPFIPEKPSLKQLSLLSLSAITPEKIYYKALQLRPGILADSLQIEASQKTLAATKANLYPTLSLGVQIGTNYSSTYQRPVGSIEEFIPETPIGTVEMNGDDYIVKSLPKKVPKTVYKAPQVGTQFKNNLRENVALSLSIPIFNGLQVKTGIRMAQINLQTQHLRLKQDKLKLKQSIYETYAQAKTALKGYKAAQKALKAIRKSFTYAQKRYEVGHINSVEYLMAQNEWFKAKMDLVGKRYIYIFKMKVLAFYQTLHLFMRP